MRQIRLASAACRLRELATVAPRGAREAAPVIADIADQIDCVRDRIGIDHIALGLDGDGFVGQAHATTGEVAEAVRTELVARGYSRTAIAKIFGGNYFHVLARRDRLLRERARQVGERDRRGGVAGRAFPADSLARPPAPGFNGSVGLTTERREGS